jgi:tetratricopeptide (TPR) repeat protein/tRNA A-37 threonylcarbamoyl transferase component Bud32
VESTRWQRIHEIFHKAADLDGARQQSAVEEMCGDDPQLAEEVLAMLREDGRKDALLDRTLDQTALHLLSEWALPSQIQQQIGPYRILKLLGEGGMGVVYLAERTDIGGLVAIKLLRDAWLSPMRRRRFEIEESTLARLTHPSIARIYDANTLDEGTPWFVMEYVDGKPITEYCTVHRLPIANKLKLFRKVCEAVQYAHSHAIIHRDLKPSNIFVTSTGEVKLLDFGIAKQLDGSESRENATVTSFRMLTPAYAAPEQKSGAAVGVYSDVYALGVLLCELITNKSAADHRDSGREKPSGMLRRSNQSAYAEFSRSEWRDLDALALKACDGDPVLRYATLDAMIGDLDAFASGRPLAAHSREFLYIAGKFVRRHRPLFAIASVALLLMAGTAAFYTVRLSEARNAAVREAARTRRIQQFTEMLFDGGDKSAGPAKDLLVTQLLERGRDEAANLKHDPEMRADMQETLGTIYYKLGKLDAAEPLLNSSLETRRQQTMADPDKVATTLVALSLLRRDQGKLDEAEQRAREAIQMEADRPSRAAAMVALGSAFNVHGKYDEAIAVLEEGMLKEPTGDAATSATAENLVELANAYFYKGNYDRAEELNRKALVINLRLFGSRHPSVADIHNNLGAIAMNRGNYIVSENEFREAVAICEEWYGANHPETAANLTALAQTVSYEKRDDEADMLLKRALAIQKDSVGPVSSTVATTINQLGLLAYNRDQFEIARAYFLQAQDIWKRLYGDEHQFVAVSYSNLGSVYLGEKKYSDAENMFREAVRRLDVHASGTANDAIAHLKLGRALLRQSRFKDAEPETTAAYQYLLKQVNPSSGYLTAARKDLTAIYEGLQEPDKAAQYRAQLVQPPSAH